MLQYEVKEHCEH